MSSQEQANGFAVEALKQILTLASLILALTVTFIKDALGDQRNLASLQWLVPLSWGFLTIAIWTAWVAIAQAARSLGGSNNSPYAFARGTKARFLALIAQWSFGLGLTCLGLFGVLNFPLFFRTTPKPPVSENSPPVESSITPLIIRFDLAEARLPVSGLQTIAHAFRRRNRIKNAAVEVVGHTDRKGTAASNMQLSIARAMAVRDALIQGGIPARHIRSKGLGEAGLIIATKDEVTEPENRRVEIFLGHR